MWPMGLLFKSSCIFSLEVCVAPRKGFGGNRLHKQHGVCPRQSPWLRHVVWGGLWGVELQGRTAVFHEIRGHSDTGAKELRSALGIHWPKYHFILILGFYISLNVGECWKSMWITKGTCYLFRNVNQIVLLHCLLQRITEVGDPFRSRTAGSRPLQKFTERPSRKLGTPSLTVMARPKQVQGSQRSLC